MPRSTAEIAYSIAWVGVLALLPVGSGFDLFRAASQSPTDESETVGRRLAAGSCDTGCDGGCNWFTGGGCVSSCDKQCDSGCSDCGAGKVGNVGECNVENVEAGVEAPTAGQCCMCDRLYVRNLLPAVYNNPQSSREGTYQRISTTKGSGRVEVTTPIYSASSACVYNCQYVYNYNGRWMVGPDHDESGAWIQSKDTNTDPNVCPEAVTVGGKTWQVVDGAAWVDAWYLYVGCDPPPSSPPPPPPWSGSFATKADLKEAIQMWVSYRDAALSTYGPISGWDVSAITDMSGLFKNMMTFNDDISSWDTSGVTDMSEMFYRADAFNQPLSFDTAKVASMESMFQRASAFNQPLNFDTSKVTTMRNMFVGADAFNQPLNFDTSKVTTMRNMFMQAYAFNQPLSFDTSKVTDMESMFYWAAAFNQPLSFDTSKVTDMESMFYEARALSDANKLFIRCAWAASSAFDSAYGTSWVSGACSLTSSSPPPPPSLSPPPPLSDSNSMGAIIGGAVGAVALVAALVGVCIYVQMQSKKKHYQAC